MNFPNRLELLFRCVCAFPNASSSGFACRIWRSSRPSRPVACATAAETDSARVCCPFRNDSLRGSPVRGMTGPNAAGETSEGERSCVGAGARPSVAIAARYWITFFVLSVLPAPDSPLRRASAAGAAARQRAHVRDEDALVLALLAHAHPCALGNGEDVRRVSVPPLAAVLLHDRVRVQGQVLVGVDRDEEQARVRLTGIVSDAAAARTGCVLT
jgi:hypothetical protein